MAASLLHSLGRYNSPPDATFGALISRFDALLALNAELRDAGYTIHKEESLYNADADRKDALTFRFAGKSSTLPILCEPHIKLHRSTRAGDTEHYFHRIYFSSTQHAEFKGKTLIGHIGEHL